MQNTKYKRLKCANSRDHQSEAMLFSLVNNYLTIYIHNTNTDERTVLHSPEHGCHLSLPQHYPHVFI